MAWVTSRFFSPLTVILGEEAFQIFIFALLGSSWWVGRVGIHLIPSFAFIFAMLCEAGMGGMDVHGRDFQIMPGWL